MQPEPAARRTSVAVQKVIEFDNSYVCAGIFPSLLYTLADIPSHNRTILSKVGSRNPLRRRGAVASLRNCLFDSDEHWWLVNDQNVLTFLLSPLVVATPFTEEEKIGMDPKLWMMVSFRISYSIIIYSLFKLIRPSYIRHRLGTKHTNRIGIS
jgi:hypothetical protein